MGKLSPAPLIGERGGHLPFMRSDCRGILAFYSPRESPGTGLNPPVHTLQSFISIFCCDGEYVHEIRWGRFALGFPGKQARPQIIPCEEQEHCGRSAEYGRQDVLSAFGHCILKGLARFQANTLLPSSGLYHNRRTDLAGLYTAVVSWSYGWIIKSNTSRRCPINTMLFG